MKNRWGKGARIGKRAMDVTLGLAGLLLSLPVVLCASVVLGLLEGGPIFFVQHRLTQGGRVFGMIKLRTMTPEGRVTRVGAFLRRTHVDELPQLINVLASSMSLVGPRPELPALHAEISRSLPDFSARLTVPAGLTGLAQVMAGQNVSHKEKLYWDLRYVQTRTWRMDLWLILRTAANFLAGLAGRGERDARGV